MALHPASARDDQLAAIFAEVDREDARDFGAVLRLVAQDGAAPCALREGGQRAPRADHVAPAPAGFLVQTLELEIRIRHRFAQLLVEGSACFAGRLVVSEVGLPAPL